MGFSPIQCGHIDRVRKADKTHREDPVLKRKLFILILIRTLDSFAAVDCSSEVLKQDYLNSKLAELVVTPRAELEAFLITMTQECDAKIIQDPKTQQALDDRFDEIHTTLKEDHEFKTIELEEIMNYKIIGTKDLSLVLSSAYQAKLDQIDVLDKEKKNSQEKCQSVDLRSTLPPIRDQDSVGWCYAYLAADLVSQSSGQNISAVELALNYRRQRNLKEFFQVGIDEIQGRLQDRSSGKTREVHEKNFIERLIETIVPESKHRGGQTKDSIVMAGGIGFCLEEEVPSDSYEYSKLATLIKAADELAETHRSYRSVDLQNIDDHYLEHYCQHGAESMKSAFPMLAPSEIINVLTSPLLADPYFELARTACKNRISIDVDPQNKSMKNMDAKQKLEQIDSILNQGKAAGIYYYANMISSSTNEYHASSLVARKWSDKNQRCEYLVRNSWGTGCTKYGDKECEEGNVWVGPGDLHEYANFTVHLK